MSQIVGGQENNVKSPSAEFTSVKDAMPESIVEHPEKRSYWHSFMADKLPVLKEENPTWTFGQLNIKVSEMYKEDLEKKRNEFKRQVEQEMGNAKGSKAARDQEAERRLNEWKQSERVRYSKLQDRKIQSGDKARRINTNSGRRKKEIASGKKPKSPAEDTKKKTPRKLPPPHIKIPQTPTDEPRLPAYWLPLPTLTPPGVSQKKQKQTLSPPSLASVPARSKPGRKTPSPKKKPSSPLPFYAAAQTSPKPFLSGTRLPNVPDLPTADEDADKETEKEAEKEAEEDAFEDEQKFRMMLGEFEGGGNDQGNKLKIDNEFEGSAQAFLMYANDCKQEIPHITDREVLKRWLKDHNAQAEYERRADELYSFYKDALQQKHVKPKQRTKTAQIFCELVKNGEISGGGCDCAAEEDEQESESSVSSASPKQIIISPKASVSHFVKSSRSQKK